MMFAWSPTTSQPRFDLSAVVAYDQFVVAGSDGYPAAIRSRSVRRYWPGLIPRTRLKAALREYAER